MTRATPWSDIDGCIAVLTLRRDVLANQIASLEVLKLMADDKEIRLVLRYIEIGSTSGVAGWANAQGWFLPGAKGNQRQYTAQDIASLIKNPPPKVSKDLIALITGIFNDNTKQMNRSYG